MQTTFPADKVSKCYDYIVSVLQCQKRILDSDTMYQAYYASIGTKNRIDRNLFDITYDEIKRLLEGITDQYGNIIN
jgi:hypothetical protein